MTRDEAIEWLLCLGDLELRGIRSSRRGEMTTGICLDWEAFLVAPEIYNMGYIEAAYLLMDGWNPGDPVYLQGAE